MGGPEVAFLPGEGILEVLVLAGLGQVLLETGPVPSGTAPPVTVLVVVF